MRRTLRYSLYASTLAVALLASGCASFPADTLKNVAVPDVSGYATKPSAYIDLKFFSGKPGDKMAAEIPAMRDYHKATVSQTLEASKVFSRTTYDAFEQEKVDTVVSLHFYNHGNVGAAAVSGFLTGFTFGVIPGAATDNFTLVSSAAPSGSKPQKTVTSDDSVTTWIGIWFLPMAGKTPAKAMTQTIEELVRDGLRQLIESGSIQLAVVPTEADHLVAVHR